MVAAHPVEEGGQVQPVEAHDELDARDDGVGPEARNRVVDEHHQPLAWPRHPVAAGGGKCSQEESHRATERPTDRDHHSQDHVLQHVRGEHRHRVHAQPGTRGVEEEDVSGGPPEQAVDRPVLALLAQRKPGPHVQSLKDDRAHAVDQVQAEHAEHVEVVRRLGEAEAQQDIHRGDLDLLRQWGWDARQGNRHANGTGHDDDLADRQAAKRLPRLGGGAAPLALGGLQLRDDRLAVQVATHQQDDAEHRLGGDHQAVVGAQPLREAHADRSVHQARENHRDESPEGHETIALRDQRKVRAAALRVRDQGHQTTNPHGGGHHVPQQGIHAKVMVTARGRVPIQGKRDHRAQRQCQEDRLPDPLAGQQGEEPGQASDDRHCKKGLCRGDLLNRHTPQIWLQGFLQRRARHIGHVQRNQEQSAHGPQEHSPLAGTGCGVAVVIQVAVLARRGAEGAHQEPAHAHATNQRGGGTQERQAEGCRSTRIRHTEGSEGLAQELDADDSADDASHERGGNVDEDWRA